MANRYSRKSVAWRHRIKWADITFLRYVCPIDERFHKVQVDGCDNETVVASTAGRVSFAPGAQVSIGSNAGGRTKIVLGFPPPGKAGSSGYPILDRLSGLDALGIAICIPNELTENTTGNVVTCYGFGFQVGDTWEPVKWDNANQQWVEDTDISVTLTAVVSGTEVTLSIDVGPVGKDYQISLRVSR